MLSTWTFARPLTVFHITTYNVSFGHLALQENFGSDSETI